MDGRKSCDKNYFFGFPKVLETNQLPTDSDIVSHSLHLRKENINSGEWKQNIAGIEVARLIANDVCDIWDKTDIPHHGTLKPKLVRERVESLLNKSKIVLKIPTERRDNVKLSKVWGKLFDISVCPHKSLKICDCPNCQTPHPESCHCPPSVKVPDNWKLFFLDQRMERRQCLTSIDRVRLREERYMLEKEQKVQERNDMDSKRLDEARMKVAKERELFSVGAPDSDLVDSQGDRLSDAESEGDNDDTDSDWEEVEEELPTVIEYNTLKLRRFSRECDRYKLSNRAGAKAANAVNRDFGTVTNNNQKFLICPNKLRRESGGRR